MATPNGRSPRHGGSHFSTGGASRASAPRATRPTASGPAAGASAPRSVLGSTGVSSHTAAATRRAG
ncbi:hypothetical protein, partial [Thermophilibacter sp.]|uniref:hypothetical protein n=1 Tax=Thermophilibacter sp. TaxID=2847309 RepID=UPI003A934DA0